MEYLVLEKGHYSDLGQCTCSRSSGTAYLAKSEPSEQASRRAKLANSRNKHENLIEAGKR